MNLRQVIRDATGRGNTTTVVITKRHDTSRAEMRWVGRRVAKAEAITLLRDAIERIRQED